MTTAAAYLAAAVPPRKVILGQSLTHLTLGHVHLLAARQNAFSILERERAPGPCDLVEAVFICAHDDFDGCLAALESPWLIWRMKLWGWLLGKFDMPAAVKDFSGWLVPQVSAPLPVTSGAARRATGTPTLLRLYQHLRWLRNCTHAEAMNHPFGLALWDFCAEAETRGHVELANDEDLAVLEGK